MTRPARRVLARPRTVNAYVRRATLGLPHAERLDTAAELRTHLLERVAELSAAGHPQEEAEYLAVQAMGDVNLTNKQLLRHVFTHRLGWLVLGALLLGGGAWFSVQNLLPPEEGLSYEGGSLTLDDLTTLNADTEAPRGAYQALTITYPQHAPSITRW